MEKLKEQSKDKFEKSLSPEKVLSEEQKKEIQAYMEEKLKNRVSIMLFSESPHIRSSEGVLANYLSLGFSYYGFPTAITAHYGVQPGGYIRFNQIPILPVVKTKTDELGFRTLSSHVKKFGLDMVLYLHDFTKGRSLYEQTPKTYVYAKLDSLEYPTEIIETLKGYKGVIAPSQFAEKQLKNYGITTAYIPIGFNIKNFIPIGKEICRKYFQVSLKDYCIGIVASNKDKETRKGWTSMIEAIQLFLKENPGARKNTKILIHTDPVNDDGINLAELGRTAGLKDNIVFQDPDLVMLGIPEQAMSSMYSSMDVLLNLSSREGTNFTVLEAGACGVPAIVTDFSVMSERVNYGKSGWLIKPQGFRDSPILAKTAIPDPTKAADALTEAYIDSKKRKKLGKKALEYSKAFTWQVILDKYWLPYLESLGKEFHEKPKMIKKFERKE